MIFVRVRSLESLSDVQQALQFAVELEHSTIPPYLTAYYSIKGGTNATIADLVHGIAIQEMGHMGLAANILTAIGGSPSINGPGFIPKYPGQLPFDIGDRNGNTFEVGLQALSLPVVQNTFLVIEEPDAPITFPVKQKLSAALAAPPETFQTIGEFYTSLSNRLTALGQGIFTGDPTKQVTAPGVNVTPITSLASATAAITTIKEQGEGTATSPLQAPGAGIAHFYTFSEIFNQKTLVPDSTVPEGFSYSGAPLVLDTTGIFPLLANPTSAAYPVGSPAATASQQFNQAYSALLDMLHQAFNGSPNVINDAVGQMFAVTSAAQALVQISLSGANAGYNAAPTYEYTGSST